MSDKRYYSLFPKALSDCVERLTRPVLKAQGLASSRLITQWHEVVGDAVAKHCVPQKLSYPPGKNTDGTLTIAVENGFATEIQYMQPVILERLASYFGYKAITRIAISHAYSPAKVAVKAYKKQTTISKESVQITGDIEDPELKNALQSLAKALSQSTP